MTVQSEERATPESVNEVRLRGRISVDPEERGVPSGDRLLTFRVIVDRPPEARRGRRSVDVLDCTVWRPAARKHVRRWRAGDVVEVEGALRRRFYRLGTTTGSRVEIEVMSGRLIRRRASA
ncbi:single-stranded DNA-binding protein [Nocardioides sp.]|uniref:single-stranded DNA-binding protein n=1 Tax=Nocardioides sp. TaxID=35761 RepID=UPI0039E5E3B9